MCHINPNALSSAVQRSAISITRPTECAILTLMPRSVHAVKSGVYANDDNRRAERGMMGSLGTPGDQPRKLLENMATKFLIWKALLEHLETNPGNFWKMHWKDKLD